MNLNWLIVTPFMLGLAISLFSPSDVLSNSALFRIYEIARSVFPGIAEMRGGYEREQIVKLYFSSLWLLSPMVFCGIYKNLHNQSARMFDKWKSNRFMLIVFVGVFFPLFAVVMTFVNPESSNPDDVRAYIIMQTKWGLPIFGFVLPGGAAACLAMASFWLKNFRRMFD